MKAGRLSQRIEVECPVASQDATGAEVVTWQAVGTVWGAVEPLKGRERIFGAQILAEMDTRIVLRVGPVVSGINATWRLRLRDAIYNIVSVAEIQTAGRELEVMCLSGTNDG